MAYSPAVELIPDQTAQDNQILDLMIQRYMGNPNINQDALMKLDWVRKLGQTTANEVILPKDQIEAMAIEATRQQIIELQSIVAGQDIPVSPRDNDMVHLETMMQKLMPVMQSIPPGGLPPEGVQPLIRAMQHFAQHVSAAEAKGAPRDQVAAFKQAYKEAVGYLTAGQNTPPPPEIQPAAAPSGGPAPRATAAAMNVAGQIYSEQNQSQNAGVASVATPPRPSTAA
jgi:hypothetical protein